MSLFNILLLLLVLSLFGVLPTWPYSHSWGYYPMGGLLLLIVVVFLLSSSGRFRSN